jgi:hypothetical protein
MPTASAPLPRRAFQWDLARQIERLDWLIAQLPRYADWGYQELYLHLEDAIEYPSLPGIARPGAYSRGQCFRLVEAATRAGIGVVPIVNLLGHTQYLIKVPALRDLNELRAPDGTALPRGQICPLHPRTLEVAAQLLGDVAPFCTAGKVHVGLDESYSLGRHPRSRAEIAAVGLSAHFGRYVQRLHGLTEGLGLRLGLWADLLALMPEAIRWIPRGAIAYDWYYYPFARRPALELRNFAEYDLAPALQAQGVEYWGCPMNGAFRFEPMPVFSDRLANIRSWWQRCRAVGAGGMLVSSWEAYRLAAELPLAVDAAAASLWLDSPRQSSAAMLERGFQRALGRRGAAAAAAAAAGCDRSAFAGYARWESNQRWDTAAAGDLPLRRRELQFFRAWDRPARRLPAAFAASVAFRRYLAERDVFIREAAAAVGQLRRRGAPPAALAALRRRAGEFAAAGRAGAAAARRMWARTRDPRWPSPNREMLRQDAARLAQWRQWLRRIAAAPETVGSASPVAGAWTFRCRIHNFAPALQQVALERRRPNGSWETLHARFTIEFRASAARRRSRRQQAFTFPVDGPSDRLRLALRGIGQVAVSRAELTDGRRRLSASGPRKKILGRAPPMRGWPDLDFAKNRAVWVLRF